ncbi:MAG TPA: nitrilase-related carbon-nitrogen hydrolase [Candidatus Dormibacteraeota bacterium]|jgi:predicted amidohydrolase|nr:nitrilase-related carbon-nitrogen hydrolase [Candidatus Dormibacteraeota bacterium]
MSQDGRLTVALAQIDPALGDRKRNLERHRHWVHQASAGGAQLVVFPELSLTGYFLKDLVPDSAIRLDDPMVGELAALSRGLDVVVGAVVEEPDHRYSNASLYFHDGELAHLHRKVYLPTYGMFDEQRYFAAGDRFRSFKTSFGRAGILVCEDIWHLSSAYILSLEGVDMIICPSASPGRGVTTDERLGTAESYALVCRTYAQFLTTFFLYCNRVGYEDGANFWGGSMVIGPNGDIIAQEEDADEALVLASLDLADVRRQRLANPLLRDEKIELTINELRRVWHERTRKPF